MNKEQRKQLNDAIAKLKRAYLYGQKIIKQLDAGDTKQFRKVGYGDATEAVCEDLDVKFSQASARHFASFARRFTKPELNSLISSCRAHKHCPSFDVIVRLLAVRKKSVRNDLLRQVVSNRWNKIRLGQEMRKRAATQAFAKADAESQIEHRKRGRKPRAVSGGVEALLGELQDDAIKWRRIHEILQSQADSEDGQSLGLSLEPEFLKEIEELADTLNGFFWWEA